MSEGSRGADGRKTLYSSSSLMLATDHLYMHSTVQSSKERYFIMQALGNLASRLVKLALGRESKYLLRGLLYLTTTQIQHYKTLGFLFSYCLQAIYLSKKKVLSQRHLSHVLTPNCTQNISIDMS